MTTNNLYQSESNKPMYVKHYGLWFEVKAIFTDKDEANKFMENNENIAVLYSNNMVIILAHTDDEGKKSI